MSTNDEWFSLELQEERIITKVQIARRTDCCWEQGQKIRITVGASQSYDPSEPLCLPEVPELQRVAGLQDYTCTGSLHSGKYVKIHKTYSPDQNVMELGLVLCEVKVFTNPVTTSNITNTTTNVAIKDLCCNIQSRKRRGEFVCSSSYQARDNNMSDPIFSKSTYH